MSCKVKTFFVTLPLSGLFCCLRHRKMTPKNLMKLIRSLEQKKARMAERLFVAEGPKAVGDLMRTAKPVELLATREWMEQNPGAKATEATPDELRRASLLQHPQQVIGLFPLPEEREADPKEATEKLCLALDGVQDPGNVGTIIRVADWFGIDTIVCSQDTADTYNPKVVQATMGSIARVQVVRANLPELFSRLPDGTPVYGTLLNGNDIYGEPLEQRGYIVMGNEGRGLSPEVRKCVTNSLLIPCFASTCGADSLNVAIATAVVCSEFRRRSR